MDVVVSQRTATFQLLSEQDDLLVVGSDALCALDFSFTASMVSDASTSSSIDFPDHDFTKICMLPRRQMVLVVLGVSADELLSQMARGVGVWVLAVELKLELELANPPII